MRLVLRRAAAAEANRLRVAGKIHSLGAASAAGGRKAGESLDQLLRDLGEIADPQQQEEDTVAAAAISQSWLQAFGEIGIPMKPGAN